jgi:hypothetical protein
MIFKDPIEQYRLRFKGWAFDPFNSTLTDFVFPLTSLMR